MGRGTDASTPPALDHILTNVENSISSSLRLPSNVKRVSPMRIVSPLCSNLRVAQAYSSFAGSMERGGACQQSHDWLEALGYPFPKLSPKQAVGSQAKRGERLAQYGQVVALRHQGFSQTAIASQVGIGHATASRWLSSNAFPEQKPGPRMTRLDPHLKEVAERW